MDWLGDVVGIGAFLGAVGAISWGLVWLARAAHRDA